MLDKLSAALVLFLLAAAFSPPIYAQTSFSASGAGGGSIIPGYDSRVCTGAIEGAIRYRGYTPNAINFNGTARLVNTGILTGVSDSKNFTGSAWFRNPATASSEILFITQGSTVELYLASSGAIVISGKNTSGTYILSVQSTTSGYNDGNWHHVMWSFDMSNVARRHLYIDGISSLTVNTYTNAIIDFTDLSYIVGSSDPSSQSLALTGDIADLWINFGTYIDLSSASNRNLFYNSTYGAVNLGTNGSLPLGSTPSIFLSGDTATWLTNKGSGGGFTLTGTLTDSSLDPPSEPVIQYCNGTAWTNWGN